MPGLYSLFSGMQHLIFLEREGAKMFTSLLSSIQSPQGNRSTGPLALPYMRPIPACRTFNSSAVEASKFGCASLGFSLNEMLLADGDK